MRRVVPVLTLMMRLTMAVMAEIAVMAVASIELDLPFGGRLLVVPRM